MTYRLLTDEQLDALINMGLKVYIPTNWPRRYCHFTDGEHIGYCQTDYFSGITFSTVHVPNSKVGTGFKLDGNWTIPTRQAVEGAFAFAPSWAAPYDLKHVTKYRPDQIAGFMTQHKLTQYQPTSERIS